MTDIAQLLSDRGGIKLDVGSGAFNQNGWVGMDLVEFPGVDIVWDITKHPYPLPDECCIQILASHILEHIPPVVYIDGVTHFQLIEIMDEFWRIMKPDGTLAIAYPHGNSQGYLKDPTHCHPMNEAVWCYFDPLEPNTKGLMFHIYNPKPWKITHLSWSPEANVEVLLTKRREDRSYYE